MCPAPYYTELKLGLLTQKQGNKITVTQRNDFEDKIKTEFRDIDNNLSQAKKKFEHGTCVLRCKWD